MTTRRIITLHPAATAARAAAATSRAGRLLSFTPAERDDEALLRGVIEHEPSAVAELFERHHDVVRGILVRLLGREDADDLVQQTFVIVIGKSREIEKPSALRSFVVSVAIRLAKNELRRRRMRRFLRLSDPCVPPLSCGDGDKRDQVRAVYRVLDRLDSSSRVLFCMRYVEGWELGDLAEAQQCSLATLKRRLRRAHDRFRAIAAREPSLKTYLEAGE